MSFLSLFRRSCKTVVRRSQTRRATYQPGFELLEDRLAPALAAVGSDAGMPAVVRVYDPVTKALVAELQPYGGFSGGVRVAVGDVNGDGTNDIITAAGPGGGPHVKVYSGVNFAEIYNFFAYGPGFSGGVFVAAGDVNGDSRADIITGVGPGGGPHVKAFSGANLSELASFFAYAPNVSTGIRVAAGDVDGDGRADVITGAGSGGGPHVKVFSGANFSERYNFFAYAPEFTGGIFVAAGDVNGDGRDDIITGVGPGGGPHVKVFSGANLSELASFFAYAPDVSTGIRVAAGDVNGDGRADIIAGAGPGGGPHVKIYDGFSLAERDSFFAFGPWFGGGIFVAGSNPPAGTVPPPPPAGDDAYEENDSLAAASNLGTVTTTQTISGLALNDSADWFKFTTSGTGTVSSNVTINFVHSQGDLVLELYNSAGTQLDYADGYGNSEQVSLNGLAAGTYYVKVSGYLGDRNASYSLTINPPGNSPPPPPPPPAGAFDIQLNVTGMTASQRAIFAQAAVRWEEIIIGDVADAYYNGIFVDDLLIDASGRAIDGSGGILGRAGPDAFRSNALPIHGIMEFDTADLAAMEANGSLLGVILHEMGHVLGIGTLWGYLGLLTGAGTSDPRYIGAQGLQAYNEIFGTSATGVPVENTGEQGTRDVHWRDSAFGVELMSAYAGSGSYFPISRVTVGSLADLGYQVNINAADTFTP